MKHPSPGQVSSSGSSVAYPYALPARLPLPFSLPWGTPASSCLQRPPTPCTLSAFRNGGIASDPCSTFQCPTGKLSGVGPLYLLHPYLQPQASNPTSEANPPPSVLLLSLLSLTSFGMPTLCQAHWTFLVEGNNLINFEWLF